MRELMAQVDPSRWSELSATAFLVAFGLLLCWVYWPNRKSKYQEFARLPIDEEQRKV